MKRLFRTFALALLLCLFLPRPSQGAAGIGNDNPTGVTGEYNGSITTGGSYDPYTGNAKRFIDDLTVTGSVGAYPLKWTRILNTRGASGWFGHGGGWRHSYQWGLHIAPPQTNPCAPEVPSATVAYPDGRKMAYYLEGLSFERRDGGEPGDRLVPMGGTDYDLKQTDGGKVEFRTVNGRPTSPKFIVDPYGQRTTLEYIDDGPYAPLRLLRITEPGGRYLEITYWTYEPEPPNYPSTVEVIQQVTAYDGPQRNLIEKVVYDYLRVIGTGTGGVFSARFYNLVHAYYDDDNGPQATYTYNDPGLTPFNQWILAPGTLKTCDDVRYAGAMSKIEYEYVHQTTSQACPIAWGQIKGEKNLLTGQFVSQVDYPSQTITCTAENQLKRTETRPGNVTRVFRYSTSRGSPELETYTDFAYPGQPHHTTTISYADVEPTAQGSQYLRIVTNARQYTTTTQKESKIGAVMAVIHHNGSRTQYTHIDNTDPTNPAHLASKTDENGKTTHYDRDSANRIWRIRYPDSAYETFTYDNNPFGLIHEHRMTSGGKEVFTYNSRGLKETYTPPATLSDPSPTPTTYAYYNTTNGRPDQIDRLKSVTDPLMQVTTYDYNKRGAVTRVTYDDGKFIKKEYKSDGTLLWIEDELGHRTNYTYDEYKRMKSVVNPLLKETLYSYAPWSGTGDLSHTTSSVYLITFPSQKQVKQDYDSNFRLIEKKQAPGIPLEEATTTYGYDEVGNQITVTQPNGQPDGTSPGAQSVSAYDDRNRRTSLTDPFGHTTWWIYDNAGNLKRETRADYKFRTWDEYDAMNRIKQTTGFLGDLTSYIYDYAGNLIQVTDSNQKVYYYTYDALNRKESATYPVDASGTTTTGKQELWRYDAAGRLEVYKNTASQYKHFGYDNRNRQTGSFWNGSETGVEPDLSMGDTTVTAFDYASRVGTVETYNLNGSTYVGYIYDNANRKTREFQRLGSYQYGSTRIVETLPDDDGNRRTLTVEGVYSLSYDYTQRQQLYHINKVGVDQVVSQFFEYRYDRNGNLKKRQNTLQGGGSTNFTYDKANRVTSCAQFSSSSITEPFARSDYNDYDLVNNLKSISREEDDYKGDRFEYDDANQLKKVSYKVEIGPRPPQPDPDPGQLSSVDEVDEDVNRQAIAALVVDPVREPFAAFVAAVGPDAAIGPRTVTYTNDAINRRSMSDSNNNGTTVTNYTPNGLNQYTAVSGHATPTYDTNFNLSGYDGWTYVYDADKRLISASRDGLNAQFAYDGLGRCVKRTIDGVATVFSYDEWKPIVEWNGEGEFVAWNLYGPGADEILVRYQQDTEFYLHYHLDAMGNVQFILSEDNLGLEKYSYDAFGQPTIKGWEGGSRTVSAHGNRFLFTGREYLFTLGIYDYRRRHYHPELGRFIQTDPTGLQIEGAKLSAQVAALYPAGQAPATFSASELNLYRYCHNDPINKSDPLGLYGMGKGWTDEQWKKFDTAQQAAASRLERASAKMDAKVFEKVFGKGSATAENMAKVQNTMKGMAAALRDDGTKGYIANARPESGSSVMGRGSEPGKTVWINTAHTLFGKIGPQSWNAGHESGHNMGLHHGTGDNAAYKYGNDAQKEVYKNLSPADRLRNPDNYMDFAR